MRNRLRLVLAVVATLAIVTPLGWLWWSSLLPDSYSVMDMGYVDHGGGSRPEMVMGADAVSVADLTGPATGTPDVAVELVAREEEVRLASGRTLRGYTLNHRTPGPAIEATEGDLVEVTLRNESVADGATLHWHGVDVPNAEDGVAGVTQDAVAPGASYTYRFVAEQVGTYWYHSHQVSHEQVRRGLLGAFVVRPAEGVEQDVEVTAVAHTYEGHRTLNGSEDLVPVAAEPGDRVRVRVVNTDNASVELWSDQPFTLLAVDGYDLAGATPVSGRTVTVTAGARADLEVVVPATGAARVQVGAATAVVAGVPGTVPSEPPTPGEDLDLLAYGTAAPLPFDVTAPDRRFDYRIGRRPGFLDGRPGLWWTVNGHLYPDIPMYLVEEGDVAVFRIVNDSGETHPMHLHGHHAVVLSRDGVPSTGAPWWVDSLDVRAGEEYEIAFLADNPGIWMDHCHNLPHATEGLVAHLMYAGVDTPYDLEGHADNHPE